MSSPLKPVNPIRLKWATSSQHTRELERRHMWGCFSLLSAPPPFTTDTQWCSNPGNPRITPFQRAEDTACPASKKRKATLLYCSMLLDSLAAALPLCIVNVSVPQPWELADMSWICSYPMQKWQISLICPKLNTQVLSCSLQVICAHTQEGGTPVIEAENLIWLLEGSIWTPKGPEIFKKLEKTFKSARTNLQR